MENGFKLSETSKERLSGVDERLILLINFALKCSPIDFGIPPLGGYRADTEQLELYLEGKSKCDGRSKISKHQLGKAFDIYAWHNGKASWDKGLLKIIAGVIMACAALLGLKIKWGGTFGSKDFNGWDMGHFELVD